ncbi:MAG: anhydro-N-acetylmuramic acid kinase [Bacteroidia bacterium]|nr:anhydro-N-acetylmuramic acid kinase [Bacteroidia bacterium]
MSGTSLDGLDVALCEFNTENSITEFKLIASETFLYEPIWKERLQNAFDASAEHYFKLHSLYGQFISEKINLLLKNNHETADYIASHGHTIFHRPQLGFTTQIGCGATIAAKTGINTICDFRSLDVALNGQGAPLVPIGDRDLFHEFQSCLNVGGIANISFTKNRKTEAFDVCIANMALNYLTETIGKSYDDEGKLASAGTCNQNLLEQLLSLESNAQSLGREWFETQFLPLLTNPEIELNDKLATCVEYLALKISQVLNENDLQSVLITGGGAYNIFFIERLKVHFKGRIHIPNDDIIQFKEAIIFAYLGYLRANENSNTLSSITKASRDSIGGCIYLGHN